MKLIRDIRLTFLLFVLFVLVGLWGFVTILFGTGPLKSLDLILGWLDGQL